LADAKEPLAAVCVPSRPALSAQILQVCVTTTAAIRSAKSECHYAAKYSVIQRTFPPPRADHIDHGDTRRIEQVVNMLAQ